MNDLFAFNASTRLLMLAPHPDDETLATGGVLRQASRAGAQIRVVYVTNGENNPWPQRAMERRWHVGPTERARWGRMRREESFAALEHLGVARSNVEFWDLPDQGLTDKLTQDTVQLTRILTDCVRDFAPTILFSPSLQDRHPDHCALAVATLMAKRNLFDEGRDVATLHYVVHGPRENPEGQRVSLALPEDAIAVKREAIACHTTQMFLSRKRFLGYAGPREVFVASEPDGAVSSQHPVRRIESSPTRIVLDIVAEKRRHTLRSARFFVVGLQSQTAFAITGAVKRSRTAAVQVETANVSVDATAVWLNHGTVRLQLDCTHGDFSAALLFAKWAPKTLLLTSYGWRMFDPRT